MNCLAKFGCATLLVLLVVVGWFTRSRWLPMVGWKSETAATAGPTWEPLTDAGAERTRKALAQLGQRRGPVFANLSGGDVASYIYRALARQLPPSTDSVEAAVIGDRLYLRASVKPAELGGSAALGPFGALLGERERVQFGGAFHVIRPGLAEYQVKEIKLRELTLPQQMIPRIIGRVGRGARPEGVAADGLPLEVPEYIADIRVANGRMTLYKAVTQ
jgi:hypothetical protein